MISPRTNRCTTVFALALLCAAAWAGEPKEAPLPLEFELSPTPLGPFWPQVAGSPWYPVIFLRPPYAAAVSLARPTEFLPQPSTRRMGEFLDFAKAQAGLSTGQKTFLDAARGVYTTAGQAAVNPAGRPIVLGPMVDRSDPNSPQRVILYAMTLDDAKKMARAYFQYAMLRCHEQIQAQDEGLRELTEKIAQEEKRLSEVDKLIQTAQKSLEILVKTVAYRTENEAQAAVGELDRMLTASQVEMAGITAKLEAIQVYRQERREEGPPVPQEATAKLNMMFVEESIALRGAEARKQMAVQLRDQASRFIEAKSVLASAAAEKEILTKTLKAHQQGRLDQQKSVESVKQEQPKIPNKIVIYPVQWNEQAPGNN
jgi:hypothetical protein